MGDALRRAPGERDQVLRPGVRGSAPGAPGNGLGLSSAVRAMRAQGGSRYPLSYAHKNN